MLNPNRRKATIGKAILWNVIPFILIIGVLSSFHSVRLSNANQKNLVLKDTINSLRLDSVRLSKLIQKLNALGEAKSVKIVELRDSLHGEIQKRKHIEEQMKAVLEEKALLEVQRTYLEGLIDKTGRENAVLNKEIRQKSGEISKKDSELVELFFQRDSLNTSITEKESRIDTLFFTLEKKNEEIHQLANEVELYKEHLNKILDVQQNLKIHKKGEVVFRTDTDKKTNKFKKVEKIEVPFYLDYYDSESLKGKFFSVEVLNTKTGKPLPLEEDPRNTGKRTKLFFEYQPGPLFKTFTNHERKDRDGGYILRLYYYPNAKSIDEAKTTKEEFIINKVLPLK